MASKKTVYTLMNEKAVCCGKIYVSDSKPIKEFKCKNCGQTLSPVKIPYVYKVTKE